MEKQIAAIDSENIKKVNGAKLDQDAIDAQVGINNLAQKGLTQAEKRVKAEQELNRWIESNKKRQQQGKLHYSQLKTLKTHDLVLTMNTKIVQRQK